MTPIHTSFSKMKDGGFFSPFEQPYPFSQPPPFLPLPNLQSTDDFNFASKVSPSLLLIIIILAIFFFISGLLHLLVRYFLRPSNSNSEISEIDVTAFQGQLQQLFQLHDAGVDQTFIDTLPVFNYKAVRGVKNPFDCAVCLCEFEPEARLRLLPKCSHAFHMDCIDTWLLSHSTCPICRASLLPDFSPNNSCSPLVLVLESGSESSRETVSDRTNSHLGLFCEDEFRFSQMEFWQKTGELQVKDEENQQKTEGSDEKVVTVKLGKFRNVDDGNTGNINAEARRCFSMGSFEYVMDENSSFQVPIRTPAKKHSSKKLPFPLIPGQRPAISEYGCDSRREFNGFDANSSSSRSMSYGNGVNNTSARNKKESFSVSKIWLRGKKDKQDSIMEEQSSSRRAFSFRFPVSSNAMTAEEFKAKNSESGFRRAVPEIDIGRRKHGGIDTNDFDELENQSCNTSVDYSQPNSSSFTRRTLLWLTGKQSRVVHSDSSENENI